MAASVDAWIEQGSARQRAQLTEPGARDQPGGDVVGGVTHGIEAASTLLAEAGVVRCEDVEPLPPGFRGFWVLSPASIVHLVW